MNKKDLDTWNDLYLSVYGEEKLNEGGNPYAKIPDSQLTSNQLLKKQIDQDIQRRKNIDARGGALGQVGRQFTRMFGSGEAIKKINSADTADKNREQSAFKNKKITKPVVPTAKPVVPTAAKPVVPTAAKPVASGPVLSKKNGVEGTGVGANFKPRAFSDAEKSRYSSVAAKNTTSSGTPKVAPSSSSSSSTSSAPTPAVGKLGSTSFERRTPTSSELRASQSARASGASPEKALQSAQKTNLPTTGPSADLATARSSVAADVAKANSPAVMNRPAPAGTALAKQQAQQAQAPKKPTLAASYEWSSTKTAGDIASAYASIYEAKKKVDQDEDNDNDFADVRIARMIASGVPKAKAIAMVKYKSYNKKDGLDEATAMAKRGYDETAIRNKIAKSTGGGKFADKATELENRPTFGNRAKQAARDTLARTQRGDFRRTTSSDYGLRLGAHQSDDPAVKAMQAARGKQRSALTPKEKKMLNREAYEAYELVASYLLENNFATTVEDANVIINNMSENWFESIIEG